MTTAPSSASTAIRQLQRGRRSGPGSLSTDVCPASSVAGGTRARPRSVHAIVSTLTSTDKPKPMSKLT